MTAKEFRALRKRYSEFSIDELIVFLGSDDLRTRFFAEMALRDATGI
jgi:hypothetical protein